MRDDLRQARVKAGLTQEQLAELVGKDQGAISRYENGKLTPDIQVAPIIAEALKLPLLQVLYGPAKSGKPQVRAA
jgi:transcriptional regulator with XRE-family HTH domain